MKEDDDEVAAEKIMAKAIVADDIIVLMVMINYYIGGVYYLIYNYFAGCISFARCCVLLWQCTEKNNADVAWARWHVLAQSSKFRGT